MIAQSWEDDENKKRKHVYYNIGVDRHSIWTKTFFPKIEINNWFILAREVMDFFHAVPRTCRPGLGTPWWTMMDSRHQSCPTWTDDSLSLEPVPIDGPFSSCHHRENNWWWCAWSVFVRGCDFKEMWSDKWAWIEVTKRHMQLTGKGIKRIRAWNINAVNQNGWLMKIFNVDVIGVNEV